jgi:hypothetical protein
MKKYPKNEDIRGVLIVIELYKLSLATNILIAAVMTPVMFFMGSDADPGNVSSSSQAMGFLLLLFFWIFTPISLVLNWYMIFSKKAEHPMWFFWLIPAPFIGLLILSLNGLGLTPFIPFAFN